ncbi:hypothetical protein Cme02nite_26280 [Catellatospora methionotrophica]|uniref:Uncharacterized protein n=1 Tax=Catellatospora methionotrophica TaxID=121620 RepID=A0A8J3PE82_9ACTN|nr:hypothetical protein [Catellatospora methionotrophica]GIG14296.1 hypothetical protein Cme02nite_26280 [Catellatospora methionotrophica]
MRTLATVLAPVLSGAAYLLLIPWDLRNRPEHPGELIETTPVRTWAVIVFGLVLLALGLWLGRCGVPPWQAMPLAAGLPSALLLVSYLTHRAPDANPWPVAWVCFTVLMAGAALLAALAGRLLTR